MFRKQRFGTLRRAGLALALAAIAFGVPATASAQGLFDFLFGRRPAPQQQQPANSFADPNFAAPEEGGAPRVGGPSVAFCVRLCDGRHFPINYRAGATPVETCQSLCPAARTKIFSGSSIDHAVASDGRRYADMPNAFVYRDKLVADCTCNGKPTGLSFVNPKADPTLRPGDIVATNEGMMAYAGARRGSAEFTPVDRSAVSAEMRRRLSDLKIAPRNADGEAPANTSNVSPGVTSGVPASVRPQRSQASR